MYNQMRKFITTGIIVVTLLLMVTASAYSHYIYNWEGDAASGPGLSSGWLSLECDVWADDQATMGELTEFYFLGYAGSEYNLKDVGDFSVTIGVAYGLELTADTGGSLWGNLEMVGATAPATVGSWSGIAVEVTPGGLEDYRGYWVLNEAESNCNAVPEPATLSLLGIGLVGLIGGAARKKLKKKAIAKT